MKPVGHSTIAAGSVTLRPWEPADVAFVYDACQDAEVQRWTPLPRPYRAGDAVSLLRLSAEGRSTNRAALFAITSTDTGELLGSMGLKDIEWETHQAEAGYWVAPEARGRGVATMALQALVAWAGAHLGLEGVWLVIAQGNQASEKVAVQAGFASDGLVAGGCSIADDRHDALIYRRPTG